MKNMKFILGEKIGMTQLYNEAGELMPVTKVMVNSSLVTQIKGKDKEGYNSVQIAFGGSKTNLNKPLKGHLKNLLPFFGEKKGPKYVTEFRSEDVQNFNVGDILNAEIFNIGERVMVRGFTKGRGFAGVVKRHGFHGHPASHGHKDQERMPGSIGSKRIGPVGKGKRMGGKFGNEKVFVNNLAVLKIDSEKGILYIKGAIPGARGGYVEIISDAKVDKQLQNFLSQSPKPEVAGDKPVVVASMEK